MAYRTDNLREEVARKNGKGNIWIIWKAQNPGKCAGNGGIELWGM